MTADLFKESGALFSPCRQYRYTLWRDVLGGSGGTCNFLMLNPSTADETNPDQTITRCMGFARSWGYVRLVVTNLFALRATDPKVMMSAADPVGPDNDKHIVDTANEATLVVCAWGNHGRHRDRAQRVLELLRAAHVRPMALKVNERTRQPTHPLYLNSELRPMAYIA